MFQNPVILTTSFNINKLCIFLPTYTFPVIIQKSDDFPKQK
jgi:hypothetical protein